jgi:hypothetical protein
MREVLQLKLRCVRCGAETMILELPWPSKAAGGDGPLHCHSCDSCHAPKTPSFEYRVYLVKAVVNS